MMAGKGEKGGRRKHTPIEMSLLGEIIVRVAVRVNRAVQLLKSHERLDEFVVGV